jgi:hypothetical protein
MKNWEHIKLSDEELKILVKDAYDGKIFTSLHLGEFDQYLVGSIFMPVIFMGAPPSKPDFPKTTNNIRKDRKNKINHFTVDLPKWEQEHKQWEDETPLRLKFLEEIGMLYEKNSEAGPRSINGYPIFFSCKIVSKEDTKKFLEMYNTYVKLRENFEKEWEIKKAED